MGAIASQSCCQGNAQRVVCFDFDQKPFSLLYVDDFSTTISPSRAASSGRLRGVPVTRVQTSKPVLKATLLDTSSLEEFRSMLSNHGVSAKTWGQSGTKSIEHLYWEVFCHHGCILTGIGSPSLKRITRILKLHVVAEVDGEEHVLVSRLQFLHDGQQIHRHQVPVRRLRWSMVDDNYLLQEVVDVKSGSRFLTEECVHVESWQTCCMSALEEILGVSALHPFKQDLSAYSYFMEDDLLSYGYPGLTTLYCVHQVTFKVVDPGHPKVACIGLPHGQDREHQKRVGGRNGRTNGSQLNVWSWKNSLDISQEGHIRWRQCYTVKAVNLDLAQDLTAFPELFLYLRDGVGDTGSGRTTDDEYQRTVCAFFAIYWLVRPRLDIDGRQGFSFGTDSEWAALQLGDLMVLVLMQVSMPSSTANGELQQRRGLYKLDRRLAFFNNAQLQAQRDLWKGQESNLPNPFNFIIRFVVLVKAGAEPTPLGGCEKFVIKFPLHVLNSFLQSFKFIEGIASQTETQAGPLEDHGRAWKTIEDHGRPQVFLFCKSFHWQFPTWELYQVMEKYLKYRWSDHVPSLGQVPVGPHAIAAMRLLCMAQANGRNAMEAFNQELPMEDKDVLSVEMARTGCAGQNFSSELVPAEVSSRPVGPAFLIYYGPAFLQTQGLRILAEIYRCSRELWPEAGEVRQESLSAKVHKLRVGSCRPGLERARDTGCSGERPVCSQSVLLSPQLTFNLHPRRIVAGHEAQ
eukprot:Skav208931  [mRNA]  locus=scaffold787:239887:262137:- [translate_table: standard]